MSDSGQGELHQAAPTELVAVPTQVTQAVEVDAFAKAAAHLQMHDKLRDFALKTTRPTDWHCFGDKPWPQRGAAEKIMRGLGLNIKLHVQPDGKRYSKTFSQDADGAYYIVTVSGTISGPWGSLEVMGFTSSRDLFFASAGKDKDGRQLWKEAFEVKEENIIQAAYTNFIANAVMRYTGISGFTKEDLDAVYGAGKVSQHTYQQNAPKKTAADTTDLTQKRLELRAICLTMCEGVEHEAELLLEDMSKFTAKDGKLVAGVKRVERLTEGRLNVTHQTAKKRWEEFLEKAGDKKGFYEGLLQSRMKPKGSETEEGGQE